MIHRLALAIAVVAGPALAAPGQRAPWVFDLPKGGLNCDSLVTVPDDARDDVHFENEVRPALENYCGQCHVNQSSGALSLTFNNARIDLIGDDETGAPTFQDPSRVRVKPFAPTESFLFEKINCAVPPYGRRMPLNGIAPVELQKLVHDWIAAGALMPDAPNAERLFIGNFEQIVRPGPAP
jgi:hypothetical protein